MTASPEFDERLNEAKSLLAAAQELGAAVFTTSFGAEDMVVLHLIAEGFRDIRVATLDTGRLPPETYQVWQEAAQRYRIKIYPYFPQSDAVESYVRINGINGFHDSVAQRKDCCAVRKIEPLGRALRGYSVWVTGLRRSQSAARAQVEAIAFDQGYGLTKINPLVQWSESDVWNFIRLHAIPYNRLHDAGYPSIGCAPCTRAVAAGEDLRAGRWWWEREGAKECGLHARGDLAVANE